MPGGRAAERLKGRAERRARGRAMGAHRGTCRGDALRNVLGASVSLEASCQHPRNSWNRVRIRRDTLDIPARG
eukprot:869834-Pyramimonas_sp.AAC.1